MLEDIENIYEEFVNIDKKYIKEESKIIGIPELPEVIDSISRMSSQLLHNKFKTGRKDLRTRHVYDVFKEKYPVELLPYSIALDYATAIGDEITDEKMNKYESAAHIFELGKIVRAFGIAPENIQNIFNEHITVLQLVQSGEKYTIQLLLQEEDKDNMLDIGLKNYRTRSYDIIGFVEIPLIKNPDIRDKDKIKRAFQGFRKFNLFVKDINDVIHDKQHETHTPIIILEQREPELIPKLASEVYKEAKRDINRLDEEPYRQRLYNKLKEEKDKIADSF